tara:strand:+ start:5212 stop:5805 length:594 start_codon:yes stop_codon:yes gene_type:complete
MNDFLSSILNEGQHYSWLEIIGVSTALIYVYFAAKGNRICFLFGLVSSSIYIYIATDLKYYFDSFINAYYVAMSFYGWFAWGKNSASQQIIKFDNKEFLTIIFIGLTVSFSLGFIAQNLSDANLPYWDAITTIFSLIATWLVVKKIIENWLIWIVVDFIALFMYFQKGLFLTAILFLIYTIIAIKGYFTWKKELSHA